MHLRWVLLLCVVSLCDSARAVERLNVVLIMADDLNNDLHCYGHPLVASPNIDRLAARGVRFDRAYCQFPLCNPSRVSLLSGRRPDSTRIMDLETPPRSHLKDVVFLPQCFRQQGYWTGHVGKIFHTGDAFEDPPSWDLEIRETGKQPPPKTIARSKRVDRPLKNALQLYVLNSADAETADGVVAQQATELLRERTEKKQPFFLGVGFRRPHAPYGAPKKYFDMYPPHRIPALLEPKEHLAGIPAAALTYPKGTPDLSPTDRNEFAAAYYACVSFVDAQIGQVLDALDQNDLWKHTVVVFCSDHGYHLGEHGGLWHKMSLFEQSARVPLIIAAPKVAQDRVCGKLVELLDVYPTLVDLCQLPPVESLEGRSLRPLLVDPQASWTDIALTQVKRGNVMGRSVRTERWRYTEWDEGREGTELYDHRADPLEYVNLAEDPKFESVRSELQKKLTGSLAR